jgi:transcription initiation factor TFIID subunit 3
VKEVPKVKVSKPVVNTPPPTEPVVEAPVVVRQEKLKISPVNLPKEPKPPKQTKSEKKFEKMQQEQQQQVVVNEKLTTEPNKQKLNIFRRISKVKEDRAESPVSGPKSVDDRNAAITESIENVVKGFGEKEIVKQIREEVNQLTSPKEPVIAPKAALLDKKVKRKKKKLREGEPSAKKMKLNNDVIPNEIERPKQIIPEQPPPYPFFTQLPDSLEANYLIPRFTNPFLNMTKLDPNCPHPEMPNLPLPPPMIPTTFVDNQQRSPVKWGANDEKSLHPHGPSISDKKLKKKLKKDKREKDKKKRDKKDKLKNKEKQGEKKQGKLLKKVKNKEKLKKKNKLLDVASKEEIPEDPSVPKIKLRIGGTNSPLPSPSGVQSPLLNVSIVKHDDVPRHTEPVVKDVREPSPELAKMPALVGKPLKVKSQPKIVVDSVPPPPKQVVEPITLSTKGKKAAVISVEVKSKNKEKPPKSKKAEGSSKLKTLPFYFDDDGNQVWVCPTCSGPDDGSPMIGCDGCDAWYHWVCVGIKSAPESAKWFCGLCVHS